MTYLIDGYNLLHAMGVLRDRVGPHGLEKARQRLLGLLQGALGVDATNVTVVFDAAAAPAGAQEEQVYRGIRVRFAVHEEADDLIEDLIHHSPAPKQLTVVSDDHRLQESARRRQCGVLGCLDFLEELDRTRRAHKTRSAAEPEKQSSSKDKERWLRAFADLDHEPEMKELFGPFDFGNEDIES
jgi:predicted RNA-binding protein with PIN domain